MQRVLLLLPAASYRNEDFLAAAAALDVEAIAAADFCERLAPLWGLSPIMALPFDRPREAFEKAVNALETPPDAVLAVDDAGLELAALLNQHFGLRGNTVGSVRKLRDKLEFRRLLVGSGLNCPAFRHVDGGADRPPSALRLPLVVKPRRLNASRGVIRADTLAGYRAAVERARRIQARADRDAARLGLIVEEFIPGDEYALEGVLTEGRLQVLALFDKPERLDGPYFEETIYVTPSGLPAAVQAAIVEDVQHICRLAGLTTGPVHAEIRVNGQGIWLIEVAARSIGGLCGRALRHALGMSLEEFILRHALGRALPEVNHDAGAGVTMIPVPHRGIYRGVRGKALALAVPGITGIEVSVDPGHIVAPPPDGGGYLGFVFARARSAAETRRALRKALSVLKFDLRAEVPLRIAGESVAGEPSAARRPRL